MGNCMYFFEAALRPVASESSPDVKTDLVKELFYGKARQILTYNNQDTDQLVTKIKEEEFSHLIVDAAEGKNLYDGLDEYFFADKVDDFQGGNCAVREVAVTHFPPILQIQVQVSFGYRESRNLVCTNIPLSSVFNLTEVRLGCTSLMHLFSLTKPSTWTGTLIVTLKSWLTDASG